MKIGVVVVLYNPDVFLLQKVISSVRCQVDDICIVDNSSVDLQNVDLYGAKYIPLYENRGLAYAQNVGVRYMISIAIDYILFMDQDSILAKNAVSILIARYSELIASGVNIAAIGPTPINRLTKRPYSIQIKCDMKFFTKYQDVVETYAVMSSGSLISANSFIEIGLYNESLFIDAVDYEWCWRASFVENKRFFVVRSIFLEHQLGRPAKLFGRNVSISTPMRLYFQFRNCIWLSKISYTPKFWKMKVLRKYMLKLIAYPLFISPRRDNLVCIWRGIFDGLFKRMS